MGFDFTPIDTNTEYGKGYSDGFDHGEEYTAIDIAEMLEKMSQHYAIMRSLGATQAADALMEAANRVRNREYKKQ